jgi:hypothetical protein
MRPRLFLYKVTRNLMHETGDTGALIIRNSMGQIQVIKVRVALPHINMC